MSIDKRPAMTLKSKKFDNTDDTNRLNDDAVIYEASKKVFLVMKKHRDELKAQLLKVESAMAYMSTQFGVID